LVHRPLLVQPADVSFVFLQNSYCTHHAHVSITVDEVTVFVVHNVYVGSAIIVGTGGGVVSTGSLIVTTHILPLIVALADGDERTI